MAADSALPGRAPRDGYGMVWGGWIPNFCQDGLGITAVSAKLRGSGPVPRGTDWGPAPTVTITTVLSTALLGGTRGGTLGGTLEAPVPLRVSTWRYQPRCFVSLCRLFWARHLTRFSWPVPHGIFVWPGLLGPLHRNLRSPPYSDTSRVFYLLLSPLSM